VLTPEKQRNRQSGYWDELFRFRDYTGMEKEVADVPQQAF